jgi:protocatechuate 4,5-dioxygenase, beta chain
MRRKLDAANPAVILVFASDHLNQWFMDNCLPSSSAKRQSPRVLFPMKRKFTNFSEYRTEIDVDFARTLLREGFSRGVDFSFSDEFLLDHAFTMPLELIRPEMDIPIVPVFTNTIPGGLAISYTDCQQKDQIVEAVYRGADGFVRGFANIELSEA